MITYNYRLLLFDNVKVCYVSNIQKSAGGKEVKS